MADKKHTVLFVVLANAFFWALLIGTFVLFSGNQELFGGAQLFAQIIGPWAPTAAFLILFKKLYPGLTVKEFYKNAFKKRLNFKLLLVITIVYILRAASIAGYRASQIIFHYSACLITPLGDSSLRFFPAQPARNPVGAVFCSLTSKKSTAC